MNKDDEKWHLLNEAIRIDFEHSCKRTLQGLYTGWLSKPPTKDVLLDAQYTITTGYKPPSDGEK